MTAKDAQTTTAPQSAEDARLDLIARGSADSRVAEALALFRTVSQVVPVPTAQFAPVKYSTSGNLTA